MAKNTVAKVADMTLDELRPVLARELPKDASFDGWGAKAVAAAAQRIGVDPAVAALVFPDGAVDMIGAWFETIDADMRAAWPTEKVTTLKIRERITALVEARLTLLAPHREALRRAQSVLARPSNGAKALKLGWHAADAMWNAAGDTATDYNHYTKRAILGSVYAATLLVFVNDDSKGHSDTSAFLGRRIEGIMRFEKTKARLTSGGDRHFSMARFLGRLRYPA
ncbi:MAG: COQ9 family protein [Chakrabartia sp.]